MAADFILPDLGEGIHEAQIVQIMVNEGDQVVEDQPLMEIETDKAAVEIPSPQAGKIAKIHVEAGQTVNVGQPLVTFSGNGKAVGAAPATKREAEGKPEAAVALEAAPAGPSEIEPQKRLPVWAGLPAKVAASPAVRRLARERGIDLITISGTGPGGRITREDLDRLPGGLAAPVESAARPAPSVPAVTVPQVAELPDFARWGPIQRESIPQIRKTIVNQMVRSEALNVHVTHHDEADIQMLEQLRQDYNSRRDQNSPKLTLLPFVMKAIFTAMRQYPIFNASFDQANNEIIYKDYFHFGVAVDTSRGLVVPVIRDVDKKSIRELAEDLNALGERTRKANFAIEELRGGTFTITNIGSLGGIAFTPIINYPESAILGLGKAEIKPVVREDKIVARYILPLSLSFDHRVIDGANAARFCTAIIRYLEVPGRLLLVD